MMTEIKRGTVSFIQRPKSVIF